MNTFELETTRIFSNNQTRTFTKKQFLKKELIKERNHMKKTLMLLLVCTLLFVAELPNATLLFVSVFDKYVYFTFYLPLSDLLDAFILTTSSINFLVYCFMSVTFRQQFITLLYQKKEIKNYKFFFNLKATFCKNFPKSRI